MCLMVKNIILKFDIIDIAYFIKLIKIKIKKLSKHYIYITLFIVKLTLFIILFYLYVKIIIT